MKSGIISGLALAAVAISVAAAPGGNKPPKEPRVNGIQLFAEGTPIGSFIAFNGGYVNRINAISDNGYLFIVDASDGAISVSATLVFTDYDCKGDAYFRLFESTELFQRQGWVASSPFPSMPPVYYVPRDSTAEQLTFLSFSMVPYPSTEPSCTNPTAGELDGAFGLPIYPNDPSITGVQNSYVGPIRIGVP